MEAVMKADDRPAWKIAVERFNVEFSWGSEVPHAWFWEAFGIAKPKADDPYLLGQKAQLARLDAFDAFSEALLREHNKMLVPLRTYGYKVVLPPEQVALAETLGYQDARKALAKLMRRVKHVDVEQLHESERRDQADALARVGRIRQFVIKTAKAR